VPRPDRIDLERVERLLTERLAGPLPGPPAQWRFAPRPALKGWAPELTPDTARQAAALILIYPGAEGPAVPLTVRRHDLPQHAGQVSLPGGRLDPGEVAREGALREAQEEIGIDPAAVRIIGELSSLWVIVSNFVVRPFVGIADACPEFRPAPREVAELLESPVHSLYDPARVGWTRQRRQGVVIDYPYVELAGHQVWGATAMILGEFAALFEPGFGPPEGPTSPLASP